MLVSEKLCLGCRYFRKIEALGCMACHYCHDTGRSRPGVAGHCPVKINDSDISRRMRPRI